MRPLILSTLLALSLLSPLSASNPPSSSPAVSQGTIAVGDILGTWRTDMPKDKVDETFKDGHILMIFDRGAQMQLVIELEGSNAESGMNMTLNINCQFNYSLSGDVLTVTPADTPPQLKITNLQIPEEMEATLALVGMSKESLIQAFEEEASKESIDKYSSEIAGELTIETLSATELVLVDSSNNPMAFKRVIPGAGR